MKFGIKTFGLLLTALGIVFFLMQGRSQAQSTVNLQADLYDLRSQIGQLRAEVSQLRRSNSPSSAPAPSTTRRRSVELSDSQIIDRLATLAIEAKDRLTALETRVARLETRLR